MASIRSLLGLVWFFMLVAEGRAACVFSPAASQPMFAGVQSQSVTVKCPWNGQTLTSTAHVVRVELATQGVSLVALSAGTAQSPLTLLVSAALQPGLNEVGVNANLFAPCCAYSGPGVGVALYGLAYSEGVMWSPVGNTPPNPPPGDFLSSLIVVNGRPSIVTLKKGQAPPAGVTLAVTGSHRVLTGGKNTAPGNLSPADWYGPNARTAVGYNVNFNKKSQLIFPRVWLVAVDSISGSSAGVTLPQEAELLLFLGASDGINLDGGGSTTMVRQAANGAPVFMNVPKDWPPQGQTCQVPVVANTNCERFVGFGLGVVGPALP